MNKEKHEHLLKVDKFEAVMFTLDYLRNMYQITGEINDDDFIAALIRLYEISFDQGRSDILNRYIHRMFGELDEIEDKQNQN